MRIALYPELIDWTCCIQQKNAPGLARDCRSIVLLSSSVLQCSLSIAISIVCLQLRDAKEWDAAGKIRDEMAAKGI